MKLIDVNLLIYATNAAVAEHKMSRRWFELELSSGETIAIPWVCQLAFVRLTTNRAVMASPLTAREAISYVRSWQAHPTVVMPEPTDRHLAVLEHLLTVSGVTGSRVSDAHLAALAIEHGATLCSADSDFSRFPGLSWFNPIDPGRKSVER